MIDTQIGKMKKAFVGFCGFGGVDIALRDFGFKVLGIEIEDKIAQVNRNNGGHVITANILNLRPENYSNYFLAHFSPPCTSFSISNHGRAENKEDIALGEWIARYINVAQPKYFTLESVWGYRKSKSWETILRVLIGMGYKVDWWHLNAADYGVPQTRKRMIVIARGDDKMPIKPVVTYRNANKDNKQLALFKQLPLWVGWFQAIKDLIPYLPSVQLSRWELDRVPEDLKTMLIGQGNYSSPKSANLPSDTITANVNQASIKAYIKVENRLSEKGDTQEYYYSRWVKMTYRCLARFQDFPDWFELPNNRGLACRGIGNAVPIGMYRAVLRSLQLESGEVVDHLFGSLK